MHSIRADKPLDAVLVELLSHVHKEARALNLRYFVGGAFARDLLLVHVYGFIVPRPTRDIDIGIAVQNWEGFDRVKECLVATGRFTTVVDIAHRLLFQVSQASHGIPLDIVPFAGVEEPGSLLRWPPERSTVMNLTGFNEALAQAEEVKLRDDLVVPVASLAGQTLLKLAAWLDRGKANPRDAMDLSTLFRQYGDAGNADRLYGEKSHLLEAAEFDVERAGASLLGEDVRAIATPQSYDRLSTAYIKSEVRELFLTHVSSGVAPTESDRVGRAETLIHAFFTGFGTDKSS